MALGVAYILLRDFLQFKIRVISRQSGADEKETISESIYKTLGETTVSELGASRRALRFAKLFNVFDSQKPHLIPHVDQALLKFSAETNGRWDWRKTNIAYTKSFTGKYEKINLRTDVTHIAESSIHEKAYIFTKDDRAFMTKREGKDIYPYGEVDPKGNEITDAWIETF